MSTDVVDVAKIVEQFTRDTFKHVITIQLDQGVHRHIRMAKPGTRIMSYNLTTYPGGLVYTGGMGCFVFERLHDMFEFFGPRKDPAAPPSPDDINLGYWHEKLVAVTCREGSKAYSQAAAVAWFTNWCDDADASPELREAIEDDILSQTEDELALRDAVERFEFEGVEFSDFWEVPLDVFTYRYVWACFAIVHAITAYRLVKRDAVGSVDAKEPTQPTR